MCIISILLFPKLRILFSARPEVNPAMMHNNEATAILKNQGNAPNTEASRTACMDLAHVTPLSGGHISLNGDYL